MGKLLGITSLLTSTAAEPAIAQASSVSRHRVSIERMDLVQALRLFSRQTGRQVGFSPNLVRRKTSSAVDGRLDANTALKRLLDGTGLTFRGLTGGYVLSLALSIPPATSRIMRTSASPPATSGDDIVVVGTRLDGGEATDIKRRALQSVSVLTDADIRQVPDTSLADVVRRVPGIQLSTRAGGGIVSIRGLAQTEDRLNGRNLGSTILRGFDIAALPSDIVSGVDVYKTPTASQIEGGIGGSIDFHTRRPFDAEGTVASVTVKGAHGDLDGRVRPYVSGRLGTRATTTIGDVGLLIGGSHQAQDIAGDIFRIDASAIRSTAGGDIIDEPVNAIKRHLRGTKSLSTGYASAQWSPAPSIEITGDILYNRSSLDFTTTSLAARLSDGMATGPFEFEDRSTSVRAGRWSAVPLVASTSRGKGYFDTFQRGLSGRYEHGGVTLFADLSHTRTRFQYGAPSLSLTALAPDVLYSHTGSVPFFTVKGIDPKSPERWSFGNYGDIIAKDDNAETAARIDGIYKVGGILDSVKVGARIARRTLEHRFGIRTVDAGLAMGSVQASGFTALTGGRFSDHNDPQPRWLAPSEAMLEPDRVGAVRRVYGLDPLSPHFDPQKGYDAVETISDGYAEATFRLAIGGVPLDGNAGLRYADTRLSIVGPAPIGDTASTANSANSATRRYAHWLPSINLRAELASRLYLRLAWSRQISRPSFEQLAPTVTLDFVNATGDAGNPMLNALRASQYDVALERYFVGGGNLYAAAFYKNVSGFIRRQASPEAIAGRSFLISRPANANDGWIGGVETGYAQRFGFLPGALAGLGAQASYTFIDSFRVDNGAGFRVPLEQMSRNNYALAATYDRGAVNAGITWIWRSRLLEVSRGDAPGRPLYRNPYGQLDANVSVKLTRRLSGSAGVLNTLHRRTVEYFQDDRRLNQTFVESRRIMIGLTLRSGGDP